MRRPTSIGGKTHACIETLEPRRMLTAATSGPDLVLSILHEAGPPVWVPGSTIDLKIRVTNQGDEIAKGIVQFTGELTPETQEAASPVQIGGDQIHLNLAPERSMVVKVVLNGTEAIFGRSDFGLPGVGMTADHLLVSLQSDNGPGSSVRLSIPETNTANNSATGTRTYPTEVAFGTVGGQRGVAIFGADVGGLGYRNADGSIALGGGPPELEFRLLGPGSGTISADGGDVLLTGTTRQSRLIIRDSQLSFRGGEGWGTVILLPPFHLHAVIDSAPLGGITLHHVVAEEYWLNQKNAATAT